MSLGTVRYHTSWPSQTAYSWVHADGASYHNPSHRRDPGAGGPWYTRSMARVPSRSRSLQQHAQDSVGHALLTQAGVDARLVAKAIARVDAALDARVTRRIHMKDDTIQSFHDVDHRTQLAASNLVLDVAERASIIPGKSVSMPEGPGEIRVVVLMPDGSRVALGVGKMGGQR
jgi:hypothetical protein